jgi:phosphate transport system substrate-binding protein
MFGTPINARTGFLAAAISLLSIHIATAGETLRIGGTGAISETAKSLAPALAAETGITLQLVPSLGTTGGNSAVADGNLDISIAGRPLNAAELGKGLKSIATFHTPFGLVTSHANPNGLKRAEVAQLYRSNKPVWPDGTPIRIILRPSNESDTALLGQLFPGMAAAIAEVRTRADLSTAATDQDNADMAEKTPGSLVGATLTQIKMEKRDLRFVAIDGIKPTLENYENGTYSLGKTLDVVVASKPNATAERFVAFLQTPKGLAALRRAAILLSAE